MSLKQRHFLKISVESLLKLKSHFRQLTHKLQKVEVLKIFRSSSTLNCYMTVDGRVTDVGRLLTDRNCMKRKISHMQKQVGGQQSTTRDKLVFATKCDRLEGQRLMLKNRTFALRKFHAVKLVRKKMSRRSLDVGVIRHFSCTCTAAKSINCTETR